MKAKQLNIVFIGLSVTSSWGNGHATTFRALMSALQKKGHKLTFLERDKPWYAANRDLPDPPFCKLILYNSVAELKQNYAAIIRTADLVIVGSFVPDGVQVGEFVINHSEGITTFYDIDTPVTLAKMESQDFEYLEPSLIPGFNLYLSFTGGPTLTLLKEKYGAQIAKPFYCSVDTNMYYAEKQVKQWDLGYLGTYSPDRQPPLQTLMFDVAEKMSGHNFVVAGSQYPADIKWPGNVKHIKHIAPAGHRKFYGSQKFTLNITRQNMISAGYSPSVRLFEAAACGTPVISDYWEGIDHFFEPGKEILISGSTEETMWYLTNLTELERRLIAENARQKVLSLHSALHRAAELENYYAEAVSFKKHIQPTQTAVKIS